MFGAEESFLIIQLIYLSQKCWSADALHVYLMRPPVKGPDVQLSSLLCLELSPCPFWRHCFPPFPAVFAGSNAWSQTGLDRDVTTGNLTLPKLRDMFSAPELLENTEGGWLYGCFQLWAGCWCGLKSHRSDFYWSQNDPSNLLALITQVLFVQPGYEKSLDNLMSCIPWTSKHSQTYKSSTSSGLPSVYLNSQQRHTEADRQVAAWGQLRVKLPSQAAMRSIMSWIFGIVLNI